MYFFFLPLFSQPNTSVTGRVLSLKTGLVHPGIQHLLDVRYKRDLIM